MAQQGKALGVYMIIVSRLYGFKFGRAIARWEATREAEVSSDL